jgi:hypothetical protein
MQFISISYVKITTPAGVVIFRVLQKNSKPEMSNIYSVGGLPEAKNLPLKNPHSNPSRPAAVERSTCPGGRTAVSRL